MEQNGTNVWNEMSYRRYCNRKNERVNDCFELERESNLEFETYGFTSYGLYEDIYKMNTFGVDELFYYNKE